MSSAVKTTKLMAMKMDAVTSNICRIYESVDSQYVLAKRDLTEAKAILRTEPKRSLKLMKKAEKSMISESIAATEYNRSKMFIPQLDDSKLIKLDKEYHDALIKGKFTQAKKIAVQISQLDVIRESGHNISIKVATYDNDKLVLKVTNNSNRDIDIRRFRASEGSKDMIGEINYPMVIRKSSALKVTFNRSSPGPEVANIFLDYEENGIVKTLESKVFMESDH